MHSCIHKCLRQFHFSYWSRARHVGVFKSLFKHGWKLFKHGTSKLVCSQPIRNGESALGARTNCNEVHMLDCISCVCVRTRQASPERNHAHIRLIRMHYAFCPFYGGSCILHLARTYEWGYKCDEPVFTSQ